MDALLRKLSRTGMRRGLGGEHWAWLLLAGAAYLLRRGRVRPEASATVDLKAGERYLVRLVPPSKGRGRKGRTARELADLDLADLLGRANPLAPGGGAADGGSNAVGRSGGGRGSDGGGGMTAGTDVVA